MTQVEVSFLRAGEAAMKQSKSTFPVVLVALCAHCFCGGAAAQTNPVPTLTGLSPTIVTAGAAGFSLTVNGTNFISGSVVRWNGLDRTTTFVSRSEERRVGKECRL